MQPERFKELVSALEISPGRIKRDEEGRYFIEGRKGQASFPNGYWLLELDDMRPKKYTWTKKKLWFMKEGPFVTDRSSDKPIAAEFHMDRMPTPEEAEVIRKVLGVRKKMLLSEGQKDARRQVLLKNIDHKLYLSES